MRKKIILLLGFGIFISIGLGYGSGRIHSYIHPMKEIEGYWEVNYCFNYYPNTYHVYSRVNVMGREINSSADVYGEHHDLKARRNIVFRMIDVSKGIFIGEVSSLSITNNDDHCLHDFLYTPYSISYPVFYKIDNNTILIEQSQGHPIHNFRLLTRNDT